MGETDIDATGLTAPDVSSFAIPRPQLLARLDSFAEEEGRILLLSAPAGFGKTTLVADWLARRATSTTPLQVAWCVLDRGYTTPYRFWQLVLGALEEAGHALAAAIPRRSGDLTFLRSLAAHLTAAPHLVLVLDNLHHVRHPGVLQDLDRVLSRLGPLGRVVLLTRVDPNLATLQELKLAGALRQFRSADLAFTREECARLCLDMSPDQISTVWQLSEGWPAIVRLLAMAARHDPDAITVSVLSADVSLADHLFTSTVNSLDPQSQRVLMLAALPRIVHLDLAVNLTGRADAGDVLEKVALETGLVSSTLGRRTGTPAYYRFHPILRSHLGGLLSLRDRRAWLAAHATCAEWFGRRSMGVDAVEHAVKAGNAALLEVTIAGCGAGLVNGGEADVLLATMRAAHEETGYFSAAGIDGRRPWTNAVMAAAHLDQGNVAEAVTLLSRAEAVEDTYGMSTPLAVLVTAARVHLMRRQGRVPAAIDLAAEVPASTTPELRLLLSAQRGTALLWIGEHDRAEEELRTAMELARGLGRGAALIDSVTYLAGVAAARSDVTATLKRAGQALRIADEMGWSGTPRVAFAHVLAAWACWEAMWPHQARGHMDQALAVLDDAADPSILFSARGLEAAITFHEQPTIETAERLHSAWDDFALGVASPALAAYAVLADARVGLGLQRQGWVRDVIDLARQRIPSSAEAQLLEVLLAECTGQAGRAPQLLEPVLAGNVPAVVPATRIAALATGARLALLRGDVRAAMQHTREALQLAAALGCLRSVLDGGGPQVVDLLRSERGRWGPQEPIVTRLLSACEHRLPSVGVGLTTREIEVLRELPSLRTVEEIAQMLFVSTNTVKTHLRGLYRKLGVGSRRAAVIEARRIGLL